MAHESIAEHGEPPAPDDDATGNANGARPGIDRRLGATLAGVLGIVFGALYVWLEGLIPRGPQEFAYFPYMTDPLPFAPMRGFTFEQLADHLSRTFVLGASLACLTAALAAVFKTRRPDAKRRRVLLICVGGFSLVTTAYLMAVVLEGRAIVDDELAYRQQAELLAQGRLGEKTIPPWGPEVFTIWTRVGATGKYLLGEPLVQVLGTLLGLPALLHLLLAPLGLWAWYRLVAGDAGSEVAAWSTLLIAASPMFIFTNALALSHTTTLTCLILAGLGYRWSCSGRPVWGALLTGTALGFGLTVRPQVVVPMGLVIGLSSLYRLSRRRQPLAVAALVASGSFWLVLIGLYNWILSGSASKLPWYLFHPIEKFGFGHVGGIDYVHTPWGAIENLWVVAVQLNGWWLGWPFSLGLILAWGAFAHRRRQGAALWLAGAAAIILLNVPYYSTGISETGPIYYFELLLPAAILGGHLIAYAFERWPSLTGALLLVHFALGTLTFVGEHGARLDRLVTTIHAETEEVLARIEPPALLLHEADWAESMRYGWVWSFPVRYRDDRDPIVTFPRNPPQLIPAMLERYRGRKCWYYRYHPETRQRELHPCEQAMDLMLEERQPSPALRLAPTAERLGFLSLDQPYFARRFGATGASRPPPQQSPEATPE